MRSFVFLVPCVLAAVAEAASPQTVCASSNPNTTARGSLPQNANFFALSVAPQSSALTVTGFELFTQVRNRTTPLVIKTWIHAADSSGRPTGPPLREGRMVVGMQAGWYRTTLGGPLLIPANTRFHLSWSPVEGQMWLPVGKFGGFARHYFRRAQQTAWSGPYGTQRWAWRVLCGGPTANAFESRVDATIDFGAGALPLSFTGPSSVAQAPLRVLANQHLQVDAELVSACLDLQHPTLGPLQFRVGRAFGLPATAGAFVSNQPGRLFPSTGTYGFRYSIHGRDFDLCPIQGVRDLVNTSVGALPPITDFTPVAPRVTTFTDACTGVRSSARMTALTRYAPLGAPKAAAPALHRTAHAITISGNATGDGFVQLTLRVGPGESGAGVRIASSGMVSIANGQSCSSTAARLASALAADLIRARPCCPVEVSANACTIEVGSTSLRRFVCYLQGTSISSPPFGIRLGTATNLGQRFTRRTTREWISCSETLPAGRVEVYGTPTPVALNPGLEMVAFGTPGPNQTIHLGVSTTRARATAPHLILLSATRANVTVQGLTFLVGPSPLLFPLPPARGGVVTLPLPFPGVRPIRVHVQCYGIDLAAPLGIVASDAMQITTG